MSKFNSSKVMPRYFAIAVVLTLIGFAIVGKAMYIMTAEKSYWATVQQKLKHDSIPVKPNRGNILSCDGQLMASSIPEYKIFMDFQASAFENDSLWLMKLDSICMGLHEIFPEMTADEFRKHLEEGRHKVTKSGAVGSRHWPIWKRRINYNTYTEVKKLPFFNMGKFKSGFHCDEFNARNRPFGSLAQRTVGIMFGEIDSARCGLELSFDSLLRGQNGLVHRQKVLNKVMNITEVPPVDGADIVTTIDVNMQDLAERALLEEMKLPEVNADLGVAILMEVQTGDVKAIVNMARVGDGQYAEAINSAISYRCEPGSVFKVASFLVALDDGVIPRDTNFIIHTGSGVMEMHGRPMKDHNWRRGGYQDINVARTLEVSSNIGTSYVIDKFYGGHPEKYVEGLYRIGMNEDLKLPLVGYRPPKIRYPDTKTQDRSKYWSKTTLPWMSIGYETQIAPINTLAFYNAIANDGKMMQPRFVTKLMKDGETLREFPPVVLKERIAKKETITMMQTILEHVVSQGLGRKAGPLSKAFKVAGKTGTAQIADEHGGYHSGTTRYWLSFAGFFPADAPRYSCIVCLRKTGLPASGGGMSGVVFRHIAEGVMAQNVKRLVDDIQDSTSNLSPVVKGSSEESASYVLNSLGVKGTFQKTGKSGRSVVPDVTGMGARDAVYEMERRGIKVVILGRGKVKSQSIAAGKPVKKGDVCELKLEI
ncbi:MAG: transpeptidase family protein [Prevotella sp.]|nr:transpeptidase family protein [Prevotella sp.]